MSRQRPIDLPGRVLVAVVALLAVFTMHAAGSGGHDHGGSMSFMAGDASVIGDQAMAMQHRAPRGSDAPSRSGSGPAVTMASACVAVALPSSPCLVVDQGSHPAQTPTGSGTPRSLGWAPEPPVPRVTSIA